MKKGFRLFTLDMLMQKAPLILMLYCINYFVLPDMVYAEMPVPAAIYYPEAERKPLDLSPNIEIPAVKGRDMKIVKNNNIIRALAKKMLSDGSIETDILNGTSPDQFITVFEFKLNKKDPNNAYLIRAAFGIGGLCGAKFCPSWIYTKTTNSYTKVFESGTADTIIFIDKLDYPEIKSQGGHRTRYTEIFKWSRGKYIR